MSTPSLSPHSNFTHSLSRHCRQHTRANEEDFLNITNQWHYRISSCARAELDERGESHADFSLSLCYLRDDEREKYVFFIHIFSLCKSSIFQARYHLRLQFFWVCHDSMLQFTCCRFCLAHFDSSPFFFAPHNPNVSFRAEWRRRRIFNCFFFLSFQLFFSFSDFSLFLCCYRKWNWVIFSFFTIISGGEKSSLEEPDPSFQAETSLSTCCVCICYVGFWFSDF